MQLKMLCWISEKSAEQSSSECTEKRHNLTILVFFKHMLWKEQSKCLKCSTTWMSYEQLTKGLVVRLFVAITPM